MPNWVDNTLIVSGNPDLVATFATDVRSNESPLDFNKILPYPDPYRALDDASPDTGYNAGGYDWCCDTWGTKCPADAVECDASDDHRLIYIFLSAWSAPTGIIKHLARNYPDLAFELVSDSAMGWRYISIAHDGQFKENTTDINVITNVKASTQSASFHFTHAHYTGYWIFTPVKLSGAFLIGGRER
jgi:hypothetical protein